jgi:hypothetical protein
MRRESQLLDVVHALGTSCGFASRLNRWEEERNQDRNDSDDHQKLDERKTSASVHGRKSPERSRGDIDLVARAA